MLSDPVSQSYRCNALGKEDVLVTPHALYRRLGQTPEERQLHYRQLFRAQLSNEQIDNLREATNKGWVLGSDRFKTKIAEMSARQVEPKLRGGNRRTKTDDA